jgi:hypothetical protein
VIVIVKIAKNIARRWVVEEASTLPGFCGAFFHGSTNWLPDDDVLPAASDVDVMVVLAEPVLPSKSGKFLYQGVLFDVSYLPSDQLQSPDAILAQYHLAGSFRTPSIIMDPSGRLTELQAAVAKDYARREWVLRRCEHARDRVMRNLKSLNETDPFHDQVTAGLFATGVVAHVLLVAGLRNPTVRRRYVAARELLADYGRLEFYDPLLALLGCAGMNRAQVEGHLAALAGAFDAAATAIKTPFFFATDISEIARPIAIDGSRELIARGLHREAVFWMVATYSRCQKVLYHDAPAETQERYNVGYRRLLGDLGITSFDDLRRRGEQVEEFLPSVMAVAEAIMAANQDIEN